MIANLNGFWDGLLGVFAHMNRDGFIHSGTQLNYLVADDVEAILPMLTAAAALVPDEEKAGEPAAVERL